MESAPRDLGPATEIALAPNTIDLVGPIQEENEKPDRSLTVQEIWPESKAEPVVRNRFFPGELKATLRDVDFGTMVVEFQAAGLTLEQSQQLADISRPGLLWNDIDRMQDEVGLMFDNQTIFVGSAVTGAAGLTVGYVLWTLRSGVLLTTMLAQMPAWRLIDPLVVMNAFTDTDDDDETLASIAEGGDVQQHERD